ncbi:hypothetical protein WR25_26068 [Diploscapter pachys]|uniref:ubiquitinyl hydrolase 1 n=1 Tax=Diploscapter pachys TaxID=2018661 RepID=A0A2A2K7B4_9BILA|nr:hypothetical protein WR25_26068 [Diploscapter pachys]
MYHERQTKQMCLVHALNALLQRKAYDAATLDEICYGLNESKWFNPHKSWVGLGNYDVNVLSVALEREGFQVVWFDVRLPADRINFDEVHAIIFNVPSKSIIPFWSGRHWFTVLRNAEGKFVNLDSKLSEPQPVADILQLCRQLLSNKHDSVQLLLVSKSDRQLLIRPATS